MNPTRVRHNEVALCSDIVKIDHIEGRNEMDPLGLGKDFFCSLLDRRAQVYRIDHLKMGMLLDNFLDGLEDTPHGQALILPPVHGDQDQLVGRIDFLENGMLIVFLDC